MNNNYYNNNYYLNRDHLELHIAESLYLLIKKNNLDKVLDVGCGSGQLVKFLRNRKIAAFGCDSERQAVIWATKINSKKYIRRASADRLPYKSGTFDLIASISVIEHLTKNQGEYFIREAKRLLKPRGFIFLITPNYNSPLRLLLREKWFGYKDPTHIYFYTPKGLTKILRQYGFMHITTRPESAYNLDFDFHIPAPFRFLPMPFKNALNYLMISSPFSTLRDSFWIQAQK